MAPKRRFVLHVLWAFLMMAEANTEGFDFNFDGIDSEEWENMRDD